MSMKNTLLQVYENLFTVADTRVSFKYSITPGIPCSRLYMIQ